MLLDGASINKSDRVSVGSMLEVELADRPRLATVRPEEVEGVVIVYDDDDIVVIDKPVGVAAHPSLGWSGPTFSATLPVPASGSRRPAFPSDAASCSGWTWALPG